MLIRYLNLTSCNGDRNLFLVMYGFYIKCSSQNNGFQVSCMYNKTPGCIVFNIKKRLAIQKYFTRSHSVKRRWIVEFASGTQNNFASIRKKNNPVFFCVNH